MRSISRSRIAGTLALALASAVGLASCASELTRTGSSPSYLVIDSILGARGSAPGTFAVPLFSDVQTLVEQQVNGQPVRVPVVYNDLGQVRMHAQLKNPTTPTGPSSLNSITITRYHVEYRRSDGRNAPGVDVPYGFDGAATFTVATDSPATFAFDVVRLQAKLEPPLRSMIGQGGSIYVSTIAEITFYGRDQAGNEVEASGTLAVNFGDFADETR
jgi:hypothetical protein